MLFNLFKKKPIKFLGRGGIVYKYLDKEYSIESEMSFNKDIDIVIYVDSVQLKGQYLNEPQKKEVLDSLVKYLVDNERLKVKLFP